MNAISATTCPDCGAAPVNHTLEKLANISDYIAEEYLGSLPRSFANFIPRQAHTLLNKSLSTFFRVAAKLGITDFTTGPAPTDSSRTKCLWAGANQLGIQMRKVRFLGRVTEITLARYKNKEMIFMSIPRPVGPASDAFAWMDNKGIMKEKFMAAGIPVPRGRTCRTWPQALEIFRQLDDPVVVKPVIGSRSRHTSTHVTNEQDLRIAFDKAKQLCVWVEVEQELQGLGFRVTIIDNKILGILRREPPHVMGDGQSTVRQLVDKENKRPERQGPTFHHLPTGGTANLLLNEQNLSWDSVPPRNQFVLLAPRHVMNRTPGGSTTDFTENVHPENMKLFEKIANFLNDPVVGIDFIIQDMTQPWYNQLPCGVNECNAVPFIDLHQVPLVGKPREMAIPLWKLAFNIK